MPMTPFSLCSTTSRPSGRWLATSVGRPMPRLTTAPSGMSWATRIAISTRLHFFVAAHAAPLVVAAAPLKPPALVATRSILTIRCTKMPGVTTASGIELAEGDDPVHGGDRRLRRHRHHRAEVARRHAIGQVAPAVAALGLDEGEVAVDRRLEHVHAAVDLARLLALGELGAVAGGGEEAADAGARGADALGEVALRHQLELDLAGAVEGVEVMAVDLARERADDLAHPLRRRAARPGRCRRCRRCC